MARIDDQRSRAAADRARPRHGEESLLKPLLPAPAALRAGHGSLALGRARSLAVRAGLHAADRDLLLLAEDRLFELQRQVVAQIASALHARSLAAATAAHVEHLAEQVAEDVAQVLRAAESAAETDCRRRRRH